MSHLPQSAPRDAPDVAYAPLTCQIICQEKKYRRRRYACLSDASINIKINVTNPPENPDLFVYVERFSNAHRVEAWVVTPNGGDGEPSTCISGAQPVQARLAEDQKFLKIASGAREEICRMDMKDLIPVLDFEPAGECMFKLEGQVEVCTEVDKDSRVLVPVSVTSNVLGIYASEEDYRNRSN